MYTKDAEYYLGYSPLVFVKDADESPHFWQPYLRMKQEEISLYVSEDLSELSNVMPKTYSLLKNSVREVLLVKNKKNEVVRVLNRYDESEAEFYSYFSNLPKSTNHIARDFPVFLKNAPHKFLGMYQKHLDGLFDASLAGGFLSLSDMEPLSKHIENFTDFSWYETIKQTKQLENIYMIFSSGGGGYLYLDLNQDQSNSDAPECILITNNPDDTLEYVPFWECLDAWMSISMGA